MLTNDYLKRMSEKIQRDNPHQKEYLQAVAEFLPTIEAYVNQNPQVETYNILEILLEAERIIKFRVPWQDDNGTWRVNRGYRVQYSSTLGPYKGGLRFHPTVNESVMKFLAFEQVFKNTLTGQAIGGGKGGSDFNPKGKSEGEIMRFCQSFMSELQKHIGPNVDVPAGDIGVGGREIGYLFGQYKRLREYNSGVLTGKAVGYWGSLARTEATGYGLVYFVQEMLASREETLSNKKAIVSGSGNVAIYAIEKLHELGTKVIACSDSNGYVYDDTGIDVATLKEIKEIKRAGLSEYVRQVPSATYVEGQSIWTLEKTYDLALPCATQNEIDENLAKQLVKNGVQLVAEGANMPSTIEAVSVFEQAKLLFGPAKAANAGGVAVSALEMSQNSQRTQWTFEEVDQKLAAIMKDIYQTCWKTAEEYGEKGNLLLGANIASFAKASEAMISQGLV